MNAKVWSSRNGLGSSLARRIVAHRGLIQGACALLVASCGSGSSSSGKPAASAGASGSDGSSGAASGGANATPGAVTISPKNVSVAAGAMQAFTCSIAGAAAGKCAWSVKEAAGGSISDAGIYSAPKATGVYHVVATSSADAGQSDTATVSVAQSVVANCDKLPAAGTWENITPPEVLAGIGRPGDSGTFAFAVDPMNSGTVYLGTLRQKVWKTTDCGSTWTHVNTGRNGALLDPGMNWTFLLDPTDTKIVYTNSGYGEGTNGAFKSLNGGVDWDAIWPPQDPAQADLGKVVQYNFANVFAMDPSDHLHLLLTFHAECSAPYNQTCIGETTDGGATWRLINGEKSWVGTEGQVVYFLDNAKTWLWASSSNGFWRTEDAGATWKHITPEIKEAHPQGSQIYRAKNGTFYLAASDGVFRSADGKDWTMIDGTGPLAGGLVSDGKTMYMSNNYYFDYGKDLQTYFTAPEDTGAPWTKLPSPGLVNGGSLGFDAGHHLLFSSNFKAGFFRVVVP